MLIILISQWVYTGYSLSCLVQKRGIIRVRDTLLSNFYWFVSAGTEFRQYDYGLEKNTICYNSATPPAYPLHKVTTPVHMFYGQNDWLSPPKVSNIFWNGTRFLKRTEFGFRENEKKQHLSLFVYNMKTCFLNSI